MHIVFTILICIIKLTEKPSRQLWKTIVPLVFPLQNYKLGSREVSGCKHVHRVRKIPSLYCIIRSSFLIYIFTHYWQKWLLDVILYRHEIQICLKLIYLDFIFMLHYGQRITQVCFNSISMDSEIELNYHNAGFMQCLWLLTANNAFIFAVFFSLFL